MNKLLLLFVSFCFPLVSADYKVDHKQAHVLEIAKALPNTGILKKKKNGYIYLAVNNGFITKIFPNLVLDGHLRPTDSFGSEEGAHISVIKETETSSGIEMELDKEFTFEVLELRTIESIKKSGYFGEYKHHAGDRWIIAVRSPELEELRLRYGLPALLEGHDFHISIGFEVPFNRINNFGERPPNNGF